MNGLPYYKAYPRDFIEGTIGMPFELKAAYRLVLDLIYMQGGNLPDDARYISGLLGCTIRKWNSLRKQLIARGKLVVSGEFLTNDRAVRELETLGKLQSKQRDNRSRPNKINELRSPQADHTEPDTEPDKIVAAQPKPLERPPSEKPAQVPAAALPAVVDLTILSDRLLEVAGPCLANLAVAPGLYSMMIPQMWIDQGCDIERDIIPALQLTVAKGRKNIRSWEYFTATVSEAKAKRIAGLPAIEIEKRQRRHLGELKADGTHESMRERMDRLLREHAPAIERERQSGVLS